MTAIALALLLSTSILAAAGYPTGGRGRGGGPRRATWDDVNVVAHGLLQLGQALKENVDKSKGQMRELNAWVRSLNASLEKMGQVGGRQGGGGDREMEELAERVERLERRVEEVIRRPEMNGNFSEEASVPFVQRMMAAQSRRMEQLVEKISQQQDKLDKQSVHLQALQNKIGHKRLKALRQRHDESVQRDNRQPKVLAKDCHELFVQGQKKSGVYTVQPDNSKAFDVLCQMTPEGGWTIIQKRFDGSQSFDQAWDGYKTGFGSLTGEFWLGLDHIHALAAPGRYVLQMELSDWSRQSHVISSAFRLDGEERQFSLHLTPLSGGSLEGVFSQSAPGSSGSSGLPFSTADRDNDLSAGNNCAQIHSGGWWFSSCGDSNLNGEFPSSGSRDMFWSTSGGQRSALRATVMKIAPLSIRQ